MDDTDDIDKRIRDVCHNELRAPAISSAQLYQAQNCLSFMSESKGHAFFNRAVQQVSYGTSGQNIDEEYVKNENTYAESK